MKPPERGAGVRICGFVANKFVARSGKFARLTIAYPGRRAAEDKTDVRSFEHDVISRIAEIGVGETVTVTAGIDREKLTNKAREAVMVDGREAYTIALTIRTLKVEDGAASSPSAPKEDAPAPPDAPAGGDSRGWDDPAGWGDSKGDTIF